MTSHLRVGFDPDKFTRAQAKAWLTAHGFSVDGFSVDDSPKPPPPAAPTADEPPPLKPVDLTAAGLPADFRITEACEPFELQAQAAGSKLRGFSMTAYTGGPMRLPGYGLPVVVDLAGMQVPSQRRPILRQHDPERIVGHTEQIDKSQQRLKVSGVVSGVGDAAQEILALADNGFPWQASIGTSVDAMELADKGQKVKANGRVFDGPLYVARATTLREVSFVPAGADSQTSATVGK